MFLTQRERSFRYRRVSSSSGQRLHILIGCTERSSSCMLVSFQYWVSSGRNWMEDESLLSHTTFVDIRQTFQKGHLSPVTACPWSATDLHTLYSTKNTDEVKTQDCTVFALVYQVHAVADEHTMSSTYYSRMDTSSCCAQKAVFAVVLWSPYHT